MQRTFSESFTNVMPAWLQLKYAHANGLLSDDIFAVANILKVMSLHRVSDIYGPLPVLHFGETRTPTIRRKSAICTSSRRSTARLRC